MFSINQETPADIWEVEYLYDLSFAPGREALSSYRLRDDVAPVGELCLVARDSLGNLAGAVRYWPIAIGADRHDALLLGPIAVHPTHQSEGLGGSLIHQSLDVARTSGWTRVVLIGDAPYYQKFGFRNTSDLTFPPPTNPDRVLCMALTSQAWSGVHGIVSSIND